MSFTLEEEKILKALVAKLQDQSGDQSLVNGTGKTAQINVRMTPRMAEALKSEASSMGLTVSDLIRRILEMRLEHNSSDSRHPFLLTSSIAH